MNVRYDGAADGCTDTEEVVTSRRASAVGPSRARTSGPRTEKLTAVFLTRKHGIPIPPVVIPTARAYVSQRRHCGVFRILMGISVFVQESQNRVEPRDALFPHDVFLNYNNKIKMFFFFL